MRPKFMKSQKPSFRKNLMAGLALLILAVPAISLATFDEYDLRIAELMSRGNDEENISPLDLLADSFSYLITRATSHPFNSEGKMVLIPPAKELSVVLPADLKEIRGGSVFAKLSGKIRESLATFLVKAEVVANNAVVSLTSFDSYESQVAEVIGREGKEDVLPLLGSSIDKFSNVITQATSYPFSPEEKIVLIPPVKKTLVALEEEKGPSVFSTVSSQIKESLVALLVKVELGVKEADLLNHRVEQKEKPVPVEIKPQEPQEWRITRHFKDMAEYSSITLKKFKAKIGRMTKIFKMPELPAEENVPTVVLSDVLSKADIQNENSYLNLAVNYAYFHAKNLSNYPFSSDGEKVNGWITYKPNFAKTPIFSVVETEDGGILKSIGNAFGWVSDVAYVWANQAKNRISALLISATDEVIHSPDAVVNVLADEPSAPKGNFEKEADIYLNKFDNLVNSTFDSVKNATGRFFRIFNQ